MIYTKKKLAGKLPVWYVLTLLSCTLKATKT